MTTVNDLKMHRVMAKPMFEHSIWQKLWNMQSLLGVCVGLWVILANLPTAAAICEAVPIIPATTTGLTFGTLTHIAADDTNRGYVIVNPKDVVNGTDGAPTGNYVAQVTFDFDLAPQRACNMWLYVMDRNGTSTQFTPTTSYQIPNWAIRKDVAGVGIQTFSFGSCELPIREGQYLAYGADGLGGSCYQTLAGGEYYWPITTAGLQTLGTNTYFLAAGEGYAMTFVVRNVADDAASPLSSSNATTTYGTLHYNPNSDIDTNFVVINEDAVVIPTCGLSGNSYVERVICDFDIAPQATGQVWLYAMDRNGSTNTFTPTNSFAIQGSALQAGAAGIKIFTLGSTDLPIVVGQYIGIGFTSTGGDCYQTPDMAEYFIALADAQFATLSTQTYAIDYTGGVACTYDVRTV